jgi:FMN phosphatase YigB (HAD superfamily)
VIFDLDDTLYDCFGQRVWAAHRHAAEATVQAGIPASAGEVFKLRMKAFRADPQLEHIDAEVCRHFGVDNPERMTGIAREAFFTLPVGKLRLFPGARQVLRWLKRRGVKIFVVSFGDPDIQRAKVASLGLDREKSIDHIFYADTGEAVTKEDAFRAILHRAETEPSRVLVVGDRPSSEIRAGKRLGTHTVRLRHGEFRALAARSPEEQADHEIKSINNVLRLPFSFGAA